MDVVTPSNDIAVAITRPSNTTAYSAGDAVAVLSALPITQATVVSALNPDLLTLTGDVGALANGNTYSHTTFNVFGDNRRCLSGPRMRNSGGVGAGGIAQQEPGPYACAEKKTPSPSKPGHLTTW